jgi:uncharacterized protein YbjT (DUF2867 family)
MRIAIIGASGFLGQALINKLLIETDHQITAYCKSAASLDFGKQYSNRVVNLPGDIFNSESLSRALKNADAAVYLVHMMGSKHADFAEQEAKGALIFSETAKMAGIKRVIFMGGLGDDTEDLSKHLASRHKTGDIMRKKLPLVIEFRASMIIGNGSVAYDIIKAIAQKLPVVAIPRWANTPTQPIGLQDALEYLTQGLIVSVKKHQIVEIGGPEVLTYRQILRRYTAWTGHRQHVFSLPFVPRKAATWWLSQFMPKKDSGIGKPMVDSLHHRMVVTNKTAQELFPGITPQPLESAFV